MRPLFTEEARPFDSAVIGGTIYNSAGTRLPLLSRYEALAILYPSSSVDGCWSPHMSELLGAVCFSDASCKNLVFRGNPVKSIGW